MYDEDHGDMLEDQGAEIQCSEPVLDSMMVIRWYVETVQQHWQQLLMGDTVGKVLHEAMKVHRGTLLMIQLWIYLLQDILWPSKIFQGNLVLLVNKLRIPKSSE